MVSSNNTFIGSADVYRKCHSCNQSVAIQVDLSDPNNAETLDGVQVCLSYECKNCKAEELAYVDLFGGNSP